jgi:HK97 family phage major capsid protein
MSDRMDQMIELISANSKAKDAGYIAPDSTDDHAGTKSMADFLIAVRNKNEPRLKSVYKAALAEGAGATGGYTVPVEYEALIMAQANQLSVLRGARARVLPMKHRTLKFPVLNIETAPAAGNTAYAGGAIAYWESEAASITESEPTFREIELVANKLAAFSLASNELGEDAFTSVDGLLAEVHGAAIASAENYAFFRGDGVGKPYGILNSSALISGTRSGASLVALADIAQMMSDFLPNSWGSGAWFINPDVVDQLIQMVSSPLSLMPDIATGRVPVTIMNMPVYVTGALPALNSIGDILLLDPTYYLIGDKGGMSVAYSADFKFQNDQGAWRTIRRVDGQPMINAAITLENGSTQVSPYVTLAAG